MTQGLAPEGVDNFAHLSSTIEPLSPVRDRAFKLAEIGFLRLLPAARILRATSAFLAVGFDTALAERLGGLYGRHDIAGVRCGAGDIAGLDDALATLDAESGPPSRRFDCLSVAASPAAIAILARVKQGAYRPGLIHCADRDGFGEWAMVRDAMIARNYAGIGELEGAELLVDATLFDAYDRRPRVATFDVFDTLIARRCMEPWRVFAAVGAAIGLDDFVDQRRAAEHRVIEGNYRFDDIYDELARHYGWDHERRLEVQALELACEQDTVIPIAENLARVRDGDLLISDMYLSEVQIRSLLDRAGLAVHYGLHVESHGKSSGRIWPVVGGRVEIERHLGDNPHADVTMPDRFGISTQLTKATDLNLVERTLMQAGMRELSLLCREARLATWHDDPAVRSLQVVQTSLNFPILLLASIALSRRAAAAKCTSLQFCSRDGNLWLPLFDALQAKMGTTFETGYFLTSRIARKNGSVDYLDYARERMGADAMVVDLCGTGWSMAHLAERLDLEACRLFLIDHCPPLDIFEQARPTPQTCIVDRMFEQRPNANNIVLELANMAEHGMLTDMRTVGATRLPVFAPNDLSAAESLAVREQRKAFFLGVELMDRYDLREVFDLDDPSIAFLASSLYEFMSKQTGCFEMFAQRFLTENESIVKELVGR